MAMTQKLSIFLLPKLKYEPRTWTEHLDRCVPPDMSKLARLPSVQEIWDTEMGLSENVGYIPNEIAI